MISSKLRYVVGSPSPEKAMSFKRRSGCGRRAEFFGLVNPAAGDQLEHRIELGHQRRHFDESRFALLPAIDLAIDAIEIANLVGIEIHADRQPATAAAQHRINEPIRLERPLMHRMKRDRQMRRNRIFGAGVHG